MGDERLTDVELAQSIVDAVQDNPKRAKKSARELVNRTDLDPETAAVSWWALGLAARQLNELADAEEAFRIALNIATDAGLARRIGQIRSSLSLVLLYKGDSNAALEEAEQATLGLTGADTARNEMQIGLILQRLGRLDESLARYRTALIALRQFGDRLAEARLLANRGVLHSYRGEHDAGVSDLTMATRIADELGQTLIVAACAHNLGFLEGRRGDLPAALGWFDRAEEAYNALGRPPGMVEVLQANRAELMLAAGLVSEAEKAVMAAISGLEKSGNKTDLTEARLLAVEVALANHHSEAALEAATTASKEFLEQDRHAWHLLAEYGALRARHAAGAIDEKALEEAFHLAQELRAAGLSAEAIHCTLLAGRIALSAGDIETARLHLQAAASARRRGSAMTRAQAWHAEALLRQAEGNASGSARAIDAGFRVIREHRLTLGASELRSHAAAHGLELALFAVEKALISGSPWRVLKAVESWRSESSHVAAAHPPADPELRHLLAELRRVNTEIRDVAVSAQTQQSTARMLVEVRRIESTIRAVSLRLRGSGLHMAPISLTRERIVAGMGDRRLISYFTFDTEIHGVSVFDGNITMKRLVEAGWARTEVASLLFSLNRLTLGRSAARSVKAALSGMEGSLNALRRVLIDPFVTGDEGLAVIPTGALHRLPWPALDHRRVVTVAPSLEAWMTAALKSSVLDHDVTASIVAGPGLPGATEEVSRISRIYKNRRRRSGRRAVTSRVLQDIEDAAVVHIAAHGMFRNDNPSFSSLEMFDGPLTVYDLEQIRTPPSVMVLSSCDSAVTKVVAGDELLGLSSALISLGVSSLVAPVVPIIDDISADLMVALHQNLVSGARTPDALASALSNADDESSTKRALRSSFVAFGA
jgi:tetratricopeptide (TPR) repeat protein